MPDLRHQDPRVDELRQRLRSLGYLDAGVDRFVLAPAHGARRPILIGLLASLRIGMLAALLLGPAAAIGVTGRIPGLVTGPRDALVVAVYVGVLFGAAVVVAAFTASVAVWLAVRRAPASIGARAKPWSVGAGTFVTVACLAYLTLWWQTANAGLGWTSPLWTLFALAVAAAISLLLGHAVTVATLALVVASTGTAATIRGVPGTSWRTSLAAGAVAFGGAAALLVLTAPVLTTPAARPILTVVPSGLRVRLVAIDGFDTGVFDELAGAGRLPALAEVFSVASARLDAGAEPDTPAEQADPARTWTTIATGQPPDVHGVRGLETRRVAGVRGAVAIGDRSALVTTLHATTDLLRLTRPGVASGDQRREMTFWEVAAEAGLRTAVVNWWATWPAGGDSAIVLTDRATLRLERGGDLDAEIAPAALYPRLREQWTDIRRRSELRAQATVDRKLDAEIRTVLLRSAELDAMQLLLADAVADPPLDLLAVYLPGLDIAQHSLLRSNDQQVLSPSAVGLRVDAIKTYYVALDRLLGGALPTRNDELLIVVTGPGRVAGAAGGRLAAIGPPAQTGVSGTGALVDVAPTVLHALGLPVSRALAGTPRLELFTAKFMSRYPVRTVPAYGPPRMQPVVREGQPLDQEMIDRLRSLGYVR